MPQVIELKTSQGTAEIESAEDHTVDVKLPYRASSWYLMEDLYGGQGVTLTSAEGDVFIGEVQDWDEDRYTVTIELR